MGVHSRWDRTSRGRHQFHARQRAPASEGPFLEQPNSHVELQQPQAPVMVLEAELVIPLCRFQRGSSVRSDSIPIAAVCSTVAVEFLSQLSPAAPLWARVGSPRGRHSFHRPARGRSKLIQRKNYPISSVRKDVHPPQASHGATGVKEPFERLLARPHIYHHVQTPREHQAAEEVAGDCSTSHLSEALQ